MTTTVKGIAGLKELVGQHLGYSDYMEITQERVNLFADATGDHQWIHVDVERATAESPFGGPIAHGYLTLSLGPGARPAGDPGRGREDGRELRLREGPLPLAGAGRRQAPRRRRAARRQRHRRRRARCTMRFTFECEGAPKPSCVSENVFRYYE